MLKERCFFSFLYFRVAMYDVLLEFLALVLLLRLAGSLRRVWSCCPGGLWMHLS